MKYLLILPLSLVACAAFGQQIEYSGRATATFSNFRGTNAATSTSVEHIPAADGKSKTDDPYGKGTGVGFGAAVRAQRVDKTGFLTAFDLGYEFLNARTTINAINYYSTVNSTSQSASGTTHLFTQCATAFAGAGWRAQGSKLTLDALVGPELAYVITALDYGSGTNASNSDWSTNVTNKPAHRADFRARADVTVWCNRVGLVASYSLGFTNYYPKTSSVDDPAAYNNVVHLGLAYRLK